MADKLGIGALFPTFPLTLVDGSTVTLPDHLDGRYRVILFYRGHW
jgi:peroxiredoxin